LEVFLDRYKYQVGRAFVHQTHGPGILQGVAAYAAHAPLQKHARISQGILPLDEEALLNDVAHVR
jgi:hypothetical protein